MKDEGICGYSVFKVLASMIKDAEVNMNILHHQCSECVPV